jgi:hypothetical protein
MGGIRLAVTPAHTEVGKNVRCEAKGFGQPCHAPAVEEEVHR